MGKLKAWGSCEVIQKVEELDIKLDALWQAMVYCFLKENGKKVKLEIEKLILIQKNFPQFKQMSVRVCG
ncbi:unnamed protein product [Meloidogyne enterolobii]|uniref:Uncharacterized protein n=1 Tax=Meloidogyne enterolobii TaxID=390850 RepID=A0ACB1AAA1_MELEN